jgi:hypothetical protein
MGEKASKRGRGAPGSQILIFLGRKGLFSKLKTVSINYSVRKLFRKMEES